MTAFEAVKQITDKLENVRLPVKESEASDEIKECVDLLYAVQNAILQAQISEQAENTEEVKEDV